MCDVNMACNLAHDIPKTTGFLQAAKMVPLGLIRWLILEETDQTC